MVVTGCGGYSNPNQKGGAAAASTDNAIAANIDQAPQQQEQGGDTLVLRLGHQTPESTNYHRGSVRFKKLVEEKTNGNVRIDIYPFRELGTDRELLEAMQFGTLDLGMISSPPVSGFSPEAAVLDLPYLFEDWEHVNAFLESDVIKEHNALTNEANIKTLGTMARGYRHITTSASVGPIKTPEDLNGVTLRVIESPVYVEAYEALGSSPQSMNFGDAYTALEQGAIDGQENTTDIIYDENVYDVNKHVSKTGINFAFAFLMASQEKFNSWPEEVQKAILEASEESLAKTNAENEVHEKEYEELVKEKGMKFHEVDKEPFREQVESVYQNWIDKHGNEMLNKIQELAE